MFESDPGKQPVANVDPLDAAAGPTPAEDDAQIAEMTDPVSTGEGGDAPTNDTPANAAVPDGSGAARHSGLDTGTPAKPAAQWDRATDTVRFDWAEIERTASQDGPNQVMAKLLVAARAEGANSRWPL